MSPSIQAGFFLGIDDCPSSPSATLSGSISASALRSEFEDAFPDGNWQLVVPDDITRLTRAEILDQIRRFLTGYSDETPLLFYFAGHGCSYEGRYVFCPQDFKIEIPDLTGIGVDVLLAVISRFNRNAKNVILIFDTCRISLDNSKERSERPGDNFMLVFTCPFGDVIFDIDGQSDFVKSFRAFGIGATYSDDSETVSNTLEDLLDFVDGRTARDGTGTAISIETKGTGADRISFFSKKSSDSSLDQGPTCVFMNSFIKPISLCNKINGELLLRIANNLGVPPDPSISRIIDLGSGLARIEIVIPVTRPIKTSRMMEYIVFQFPGFFASASLLFSRGPIPRLAGNIFEAHGFQIWSEGTDVWFASRKIGPVLAKAAIRMREPSVWVIELKCFGGMGNDGWALDRYDNLLAPLLKSLMGISN